MFVFATVLSYITNLQVRKEEKGASAVEYAILVAAIIALLAGATAIFGTELKAKFDSLL